MALEFQAWPKIARLNRDMIVTEKIDGTNAAVIIEPSEFDQEGYWDFGRVYTVKVGDSYYDIGAQSRKRLIYPHADNFGFANWVFVNAKPLVRALGAGRHYGEWWGSGIQRGYGLTKGEKRFSLFNVHRYADVNFSELPNVGLVPVLYEGPFSVTDAVAELDYLDEQGSQAAPGFDKPEGVVVFHVHGNLLFKATIEGDEAPKSALAAQAVAS